MDVFRKYWVPLIKPFYRFVRRHTAPMSHDEAEGKKEFLAKIYFVSAVTLFTYFTAYAVKNNIDFVDYDNPARPRHVNLIANSISAQKGNVRYIRFDGFKKTEDIIFNAEEELKKYDKPDSTGVATETNIIKDEKDNHSFGEEKGETLIA